MQRKLNEMKIQMKKVNQTCKLLKLMKSQHQSLELEHTTVLLFLIYISKTNSVFSCKFASSVVFVFRNVHVIIKITKLKIFVNKFTNETNKRFLLFVWFNQVVMFHNMILYFDIKWFLCHTLF